MIQPLLDDNKVNTSNTTDSKGESKTEFWHKNANESDFDSKEEKYSDVNVQEANLEGEQLSHEKMARLEIKLQKIR